MGFLPKANGLKNISVLKIRTEVDTMNCSLTFHRVQPRTLRATATDSFMTIYDNKIFYLNPALLMFTETVLRLTDETGH